MTLFPQIDSFYYSEGDQTVRTMMEYYYAQAININMSFWNEADIDHRFAAGDQTLWNDIYGNLPAFRRRQFNFNRIRRVRNMITGYQRQHRFSTVVVPVENSDQDTSDQLSRVLFWANSKGNVLETISQAFEGAVTCGMNLLATWMDYREDPISGDIKVDNVAYNEYLIDPFFKKMDLSDCRFLWTRKNLSKNEIISLLPDRKADIESMQARGWRDGKFQFQPQAYNYSMQDLLTYDEFWYLDYRNRKLLVDTTNGQTLEWKGDDDNLKAFISQFPEITVVDQQVPSCKLAIVVNGRTMYHGPNPMGIDKYPFVPVWCYYEPQIPYFPWRVQGVVRGLRDAQYLYNRRKVIELDILESQINSGIKYKEDSLVNPKDAFLTGQGRSLALKKEAMMDDVQQILPPQIPPSMFQLSEILGREIQEISGVNEELLGSAVDDKAGVLSMLRQGAGLTTLQNLFDQLNQSQKLLGQIFIDLIQANFSPGKVKRILNEEPTDEFYNRAFGKYDCEVEEGLYTSTQKQMQFAQLLQLRQLEIPVPTSLLVETSTLQNKKQLIEAIQQEEQARAQAEQEAQQVALQEQAARMQSYEAKAFADEGLGIERYSRVQENRALAVERIAEAQKDRSMGVYNEIKAAKELQEMDITQLQKLVDIVLALKDAQKQKEEEERSAVVGSSPVQAPS
jgi:Ni,Fe-hydrogenase maturation factor